MTNTENSSKKDAVFVAIASDHAAFSLKQRVIAHLQSQNIEVLDKGAYSSEKSCDYPDFASDVAQLVAEGKSKFGILICGTGIGMSIAANKFKGVRCALCTDTYMARMTRLHNDANVLALGERVLGEGLALDIVDVFLGTDFSNDERHIRRIGKIADFEKRL